MQKQFVASKLPVDIEINGKLCPLHVNVACVVEEKALASRRDF